MKTRLLQPWHRWQWLMYPQPRVHMTNSQLANILTLFLYSTVSILILLIFQLLTKPHTTLRVQFVPMVQFNRGNVNKEQVMDNARRCLEKVSDFQHNGHENLKDPKFVISYLLQMMNKKEKRQFLALKKAFNIFDMKDFESLMALGYHSNLHINGTPALDYKSSGERSEHVSPNYKNVCYKTGFTLSNSSRPLDSNFCTRLKSLESEINSGKELPLLTMYTWWPDPITDPEIFSKRAVTVNWNLFRPFVVPVVFTNHRMNMAVANDQGWPCLPVTKENEDGIPVFKHTAVAMDKKFNSTFRGYAMANSMFDSSLLQTLLSIKDRFVNELLPFSKNPILIYGNQINMPSLGTEAFTNHETFHKNVEKEFRKNPSTASSTKNNYIFYKDIDFNDYFSVVIDDEYLIPYLVHRTRQTENVVIIDTSETILAAKTYRRKKVNDRGRYCITFKPRDILYNKRLVGPQKSNEKTGGSKVKRYRTVYNEKNHIIQVEPFQ